jgi:hypothetical protein
MPYVIVDTNCLMRDYLLIEADNLPDISPRPLRLA